MYAHTAHQYNIILPDGAVEVRDHQTSTIVLCGILVFPAIFNIGVYIASVYRGNALLLISVPYSVHAG